MMATSVIIGWVVVVDPRVVSEAAPSPLKKLKMSATTMTTSSRPLMAIAARTPAVA
jgi:hypothetical protein